MSLCKNAKTPRSIVWTALLSIALFLIGLACQTLSDRSKTEGKNTLPVLGVCSAPDTLQELIAQGSSAAAAWRLSDSIIPPATLTQAIDRLALHRSPSGDRRFDTADCSLLIKTMYRNWGIVFDPRDTTTASFFPQTVYRSKKGSCLGIALLFLLIAERNGYPVGGVVLPGHFFLRAREGTKWRNIEPNASGIERSEDYYRQHYGIAAGSWYNPLRTLSKKETAAVFYYMLGNACREKGKLREAVHCYKTALRLFPDYPDALGNMALVFSSQGRGDSALALLNRVALLNPGDRKIWVNKGCLLLQMGRHQAAFDLATERLAITPDDAGLLYIGGLGAVKTGRDDIARDMLRRLSVDGDPARVKELERLLLSGKR
jgi:regulator of sirC expression with transglutaminase-like and TPR domain